MKKLRALIILVTFFILCPSIIFAATVKDAESLWGNGQAALAFQTLETIITQNPGNHLAWFTTGNYLMLSREYLKAINVYKQTVSLKPGHYDQQIRDMMIRRIKDELVRAGREVENYPRIFATRNAQWIIEGLPDFVPINQMGEYTDQINQILIDRVKYSLERGNVKLADSIVFISPGWKNEKTKNDFYNIIMDHGDKADDKGCLAYYDWAGQQKINSPKNKIAAARLWNIAKRIESEYIDKDFEFFCNEPEKFRTIARFWDSSYPPEIKKISSGVHTFNLEPDEVLEFWIILSPEGKSNYSIEGENGNKNYILIFENGKKLNAWETEVIPFNIYGMKCKIKQLKEKNIITLTINK